MPARVALWVPREGGARREKGEEPGGEKGRSEACKGRGLFSHVGGGGGSTISRKFIHVISDFELLPFFYLPNTGKREREKKNNHSS